jgi:hypothetical protein
MIQTTSVGAICADARGLANASLRQRQGRTQTQQRNAIALTPSLPNLLDQKFLQVQS